MRAIIWEQWVTMGLNPCGVCAGRNGNEYQQGKGPHPPAHANCQCRRVYLRTEIVEDAPASEQQQQGGVN